MSYTLEFPIQYFPNPLLFGSVGLGSLYVGVVDGDPAATPADRIQVYIARQGATDLAISQPISISSGGVPYYNGSPVTLKINAAYSIAVTDFSGQQVYYSPRSGEEIQSLENIAQEIEDLTDSIGGITKVLNNFAALSTTEATIGDLVVIKCHTSGTVGGGDFIAVTSAGLTPDGGCISTSGTAGVYWKRREFVGGGVNITWYGVVPTITGVPGDTTSIQQAVMDNPNVRSIYYPNGRYSATMLSKTNTGLELIYGDNALFIGVATTPTRCLFELKTGNGFHMHGIKIAGVQNQNYVCGMHWYTNNTGLYYPGKATLDIEIGEFLIGLNVGMLPSQTTYYNTPQANGIAVDSPLSECQVKIKIQDCPVGLRMCQPNGKLTLINSYIEATALAWPLSPPLPALPRPAQSTWKALLMERFGEITMSGGSLENITSTTGSLIEMNSTNVMLDNVILESSAPIRLKGQNPVLRISKMANYGYNSTSRPAIFVETPCKGSVNLDNTWVTFPPQNMTLGTGSAILAQGTSNISSESFAECPDFVINLDQVELRDIAANSGGAWRMITKGIRLNIDGCTRLTSFQAADESSTRLVNARINTSTNNLLSVDNSNSSVAAYPQTASASSGGWSFVLGGSAQYGSQAPTGSLVLETLNGVAQTYAKVIRLKPAAGVTITAESQTPFLVQPLGTLFIEGRINTGGAAPTVNIKVKVLDFSGATITTLLATGGAGNLLPSDWTYFSCWVQMPTSAAKASLVLEAQNGADVQFADIAVYHSK